MNHCRLAPSLDLELGSLVLTPYDKVPIISNVRKRIGDMKVKSAIRAFLGSIFFSIPNLIVQKMFSFYSECGETVVVDNTF